MIQREPFLDGMKLQLEGLRAALGRGMPRRGWKIGFNVPEIRSRLKLPHPGVGWLRGDRLLESGATHAAPAGSRLAIEPELALRLGRCVEAPCGAQVAAAAIALIHPALELVDYAKPVASLAEMLGHCMFHEAAVLGAPVAPERMRELGADSPRIRVGDRRAARTRSDLVPAEPGEAVRFVAEYLAEFGERLEAGDLILCGSYLAEAPPIAPGEQAVAEFGALGAVTVRIEG